MKKITAISLTILLTAISFAVIGCSVRILEPDLTPPSAPRGITTSTGDNYIIVSWLANPEPDVEGYKVYVATSYNGRYEYIGTTHRTYFTDTGARNGYTYYYAVSAFDRSDNESDLSADVIYDTPRPEGANVILYNYRTQPGLAGYDFSSYSVGDYNDQYTDFYFEYYQGNFYLDVWTDSDIEDMGYTASLYEIGEAPTSGWSPTKDVPVIIGHTYVIRTWDNHYAKVRVTAVSSSSVVFDWAYQLQTGNARLKQGIIHRKPLTSGSGVLGRL